MKMVRFEDIKNLNIPPENFYYWVEDMLKQKNNVMLPPKISLRHREDAFFRVMPSVLPAENVMGVKIVSRNNSTTTIYNEIMLYRQDTGENLAMLDGTYITSLRTGAVAAHSIDLFSKKGFSTVAFIGLGNTARAVLHVFAKTNKDKRYQINLLRYKNHTELFIERFKDYENLEFIVYDDVKKMISESDVTVSSVTFADFLFAEDIYYKPGCTIIPVHTRGFQNCDLFFDKVFADDKGHVEGFTYFDKFKEFAEVNDVVIGAHPGRVNDEERILVYNIGISIHDIYFANKIYSMLGDSDLTDVNLAPINKERFWV